MGPVPLPRAFFQRPHLVVARSLLGNLVVHGGCVGRIVEVESYAARGDAACHTAARPSSRVFLDSHPAGTAYVYLNYGLHWMLNVVAKDGRRDGLILIRALEPLAGLAAMAARRRRTDPVALCSGPGKLAQALALDGRHHGSDLTTPGGLFLAAGAPARLRITRGPRIGIRLAVEKPWRFHLLGNPHVSKGG